MNKLIVLLALLLNCTLYAQRKHAKQAVAQKPVAIAATDFIHITVLHNGNRVEIDNKQFETSGGSVMPNGDGQSVILNYGASNSTANNKSFSWMFTIPQAAKGTYAIGDKSWQIPPSLMFSTTAFPKIQVFLVKSGRIIVEDYPLPGGFIKGSFSALLTGGVNSDGVLDESEYTLEGNFSLQR